MFIIIIIIISSSSSIIISISKSPAFRRGQDKRLVYRSNINPIHYDAYAT